MFLTTAGNNFNIMLTSSELSKYDNGGLIIRGKVKEGHRTYPAFHHAEFIKKLFANVEIPEHPETKAEKGK